MIIFFEDSDRIWENENPLLLLWGLIYPWLDIFPNSDLLLGFNQLIGIMNEFKPFYSSG
ncbi:hypothetical protein PL9631_660033 [Planktothrix paucivesiculata PCC 9631]|uniref:Uncharacterized protein n=1 Tax=Planktothrix paucivesiculata PCC 9631 TaxID=671071 RepID=A0A7Z9BZG7_9CYAN|nr:hypothetical protein PL9631_660033 [Planktothrix paucivesiculata PCC 9631]